MLTRTHGDVAPPHVHDPHDNGAPVKRTPSKPI